MSLISNDQNNSQRRHGLFPKLNDASQFTQWKRNLENYLFSKAKINDMDKLTARSYLDDAFFKKTYKDEYKIAAAALPEGHKQHPLKHPPFMELCSDYALEHGEGYQEWLYQAFSEVQLCLSDDIAEQVSGIRQGDLVGLIDAIKLAVHQHEINNPHQVEIDYSSATMDTDGKNDVMTYISVLATFMRRLETAGLKVSDAKAQRVLLNGVHQDIFESFINEAERNPYESYRALVTAFKTASARPRLSAKLAALKPGRAQIMTAVSAPHRISSQESRFAQIESVLVALGNASLTAGSSKHNNTNNTTKPNNRVCFRWEKFGECKHGGDCAFSHAGPRGKHVRPSDKVCTYHPNSVTHTTEQCRDRLLAASHRVNLTTHDSPGGYEFSMVTVESTVPAYVFTMNGATKINKVVVDGASTTSATFDESRCFNIRECAVTVRGPNSKDSFLVTKIGSTAFNIMTAGRKTRLSVDNVLISERFPFHILSEIVCFEKNLTAIKKKNSWQFYKPDASPLFHASQHLIKENLKLYFIDDGFQPGGPFDNGGIFPDPDSTFRASKTSLWVQGKDDFGTDDSDKCSGASRSKLHESSPVSSKDVCLSISAIDKCKEQVLPPPKVNTAKNLHMLLELHCSLGHRNFTDVAKKFGLSLPFPPPTCWACLIGKPRRITPDKVSTRTCTRVSEGIAADAKGPMATTTPEGYKHFFILTCLFSKFVWVAFAKSLGEWENIWPAFVKREEARAGKDRCVSFILTDNHKVHTQESMVAFNDDRGIQTTTAAPYSQWQDPAEREIQTITSSARTSLIHGGGLEWMWMWAVRNAVYGHNCLPPPQTVTGYENASRRQIAYPATTAAKELRTLVPFLCLAIKYILGPGSSANFKPRGVPCVCLCYVTAKKSYALLTLPDLTLTFSVECKMIKGTFPLRARDTPTNQLASFMRSPTDAERHVDLHGPGDVLRRRGPHAGISDSPSLHQTPVAVRLPAPAQVPAPGPGVSSTRGYMPSAAGLQSLAQVNTTVADGHAPPMFTPDMLAARTPRSIHQALAGPDSEYWLAGILKDFKMLRDLGCFTNITTTRPPGKAPPPAEQRFKIKYREQQPIALGDLPPQSWKVRTVARGDRFRPGEHFDKTAAPTIHAPTLKIFIAWIVQEGLLPYQFDQSNAFYGNPMDVAGIILMLPPGFDPQSDKLRPLHLPPLYGEMVKGVPGIPQGSLLQYNTVAPRLRNMGFEPMAAEPCLFLHTTKTMATSLFVDDGVLGVPTHADAEQFFKEFGRDRKVTWEPLSNTLGIEFVVKYDPHQRSIFMHQEQYALTVLERAGMQDCSPAKTPAVAGRNLSKTDGPATDTERAALEEKGLHQSKYRSVCAAINYLATITRDDIRFAQGKNAKYCLNPGAIHFLAQQHLLKFIKGTTQYGVEFVWKASDPAPVDGPLTIEAFSDSSFADDIDTARTTVGNVIKVNGATVSATSKLGKRVDSCVNHSELDAFTDCVDGTFTDSSACALVKTSRTVKWLRGIKAAFERRDEANMPPTPVYVDNAGVLSMVNDVTIKAANKHIYRTLAEARVLVQVEKVVTPIKIDTNDNISNAMTKQEPGIEKSAAQLRQVTGPALY